MTLGDFEGHFGDLHTVAILCAQLTRDLLAIAKLLVNLVLRRCRPKSAFSSVVDDRRVLL